MAEDTLTVRKQDMVDSVAEQAGLTKADAKAAVEATFGFIEKALCAGSKVSIPGFGSFEAKKRAERTGRNPKTKEEITIPATTVCAYKAAAPLKQAVAAARG